MDRSTKILKNIKKNGFGIEIGPSFNPVAPKRAGYKVEIIDHASQEDLIVKYKSHNVDTNLIEKVDYIWNGEKYSKLTDKCKFYDWLIASHVIEHTPDLIGFIQNCGEILKEDGIISLVIPDKRFCFDRFRPVTGISKIIDSHFQKNSIHSPGTVVEYFLNVVSKEKKIAWGQDTQGVYELKHTLNDAIRGMNSVISNKKYIDVHNWCFTPHVFRLLINDLYDLGLIQFRELEFFPTDGFEFYMTLSKKGAGINESRLDILELIEEEIRFVDY